MSEKSQPRLGVAVLVSVPGPRLLLGRRGKGPNYGKWVIPGGGVKLGQTIVETARREVEEEIGLRINLTSHRPQHVLEIINGDEHRVILFMQATGDGAEPVASSDLLEARYFNASELPGLDISPVLLPVLRKFGWL